MLKSLTGEGNDTDYLVTMAPVKVENISGSKSADIQDAPCEEVRPVKAV